MIIAVIFFARIIQSCCSCGTDTIPFDYSLAAIKNIDNSGSYAVLSEENVMYSKAVAFEVTVSGDYGMAFLQKKQLLPAFSDARALSCDCSPLFGPQQQITSVTVTTLVQISPSITAGEDVTGLFLATVNEISGIEYLYRELSSIYEDLNPEMVSDTPSVTFRLFFTGEVLNDLARFTVTIGLSDGRSLTATTEPITIVTNE